MICTDLFSCSVKLFVMLVEQFCVELYVMVPTLFPFGLICIMFSFDASSWQNVLKLDFQLWLWLSCYLRLVVTLFPFILYFNGTVNDIQGRNYGLPLRFVLGGTSSFGLLLTFSFYTFSPC